MQCSHCGQYLADGSKLCANCGRSASGSAMTNTESPKSRAWVWVLLVAVIAIALAGYWVFDHRGVRQTLVFREVQPHPIIDTTVTVRAGLFAYYKFDVPAAASGIVVYCDFTASGGAKNDIELLVVDFETLAKYHNGDAITPYSSSGRVTQGHVIAVLPGAGTYYLLLNNRFSPTSPKSVHVKAVVGYSEPSVAPSSPQRL